MTQPDKKNIWGETINTKQFLAAQQRRAELRAKRLGDKRKNQQQFQKKMHQLRQKDLDATDDDEATVLTQVDVDKDVKTVKEQQLELAKQQEDKIDELEGTALDKIDKVQKDIDSAILTADPSLKPEQQVFNAVKKELAAAAEQEKLIPANQQQVAALENYLIKKEQLQNPTVQNYRDLSLPFNRSNYLKLIEQIISKMSDLTVEQKNKLYNRYRFIRKPNQKFQTSAQLLTRLNALYGKYESWKQGHNRVNFILKKINSQLKFMDKNPEKWYAWYLKKVQHISQNSDLWDTMVSQPIMLRQMERRRQSIIDKRERVMANIHYYYRKYQQANLTRVQKLTELMQKRTQLFQQQKKVLAFLVDQKNTQISSLQVKMKQQQEQHTKNLNQLRKKAIEALQAEKNKQKELTQQIKLLEKENTKDQIALKQKNDQLAAQRNYIVAQQQKNMEDQKRMVQLHLKNVELNQQLKESHQRDRNDLIAQQQQLTNQFTQEIGRMNQYIQELLAGKQATEHNFQLYVNQQNMNMLQIQADHQRTLQGKQAEFASYQQRVQQQFQKQRKEFETALNSLAQQNQSMKSSQIQLSEQKSKLQSELSSLRSQVGYSKTKQNDLLQKSSKIQQELNKVKKNLQEASKKEAQLRGSVQSTKKKQQEDNKVYKQTMQAKIDEITKQLNLAKQNNTKLQQKYKDKVEKLNKDKQDTVNKLINQLKQSGTQIQKLQISKLQLNRQLKALSEIVDKYSSAKDMETAFFAWSVNGFWTLRQCFRQRNEEKWIASTRGITTPSKNLGAITEVMKYWRSIKQSGKQSFPKNKEVKRLKATDLLSILDTYKGVNFFGLRQGFWKDGTLMPTRRGINVSWDQLDLLFTAFKVIDPNQMIKNVFK